MGIVLCIVIRNIIAVTSFLRFPHKNATVSMMRKNYISRIIIYE